MLILSLISEERGTSPKGSRSRVQWIITKYSKAGNSTQRKQGFSGVGIKAQIMTGKDPRGSVMYNENVAKVMISRCIDWQMKVSLGLDRNTAMRKQVF